MSESYYRENFLYEYSHYGFLLWLRAERAHPVIPSWLWSRLQVWCAPAARWKGDVFYGHAALHPYSTRSAGCGPDWLYRAPLVARENRAGGAARGGRTPLSGGAPGHRRPHGGHSAPSLVTTLKPGTGFVSCSLPADDTSYTAGHRNTPHGSIAQVLRTPLATAAATAHVPCLSVTRVALRLCLRAPPQFAT